MIRYFLFFLFLANLSLTCFAQKNNTKREVKAAIHTNVLGPLSAGFEFKVANSSSICFTPRYISLNFFTRTTILSLTLEHRIYFNSTNLNGFYLGPYLKFRHRVDSHENDGWNSSKLRAEANFLGGGLVCGYQKTFPNGFLLNFYGGPGYMFLLNKKVINDDPTYWDGVNLFDFRLGAAIGYAF